MPIFIVLDLIALAFLATGLMLLHSARSYRADDAPPMISWNPKHWRPAWMTRSWFVSDRGYRYYLMGAVLCSFGGLLIIVVSIVQ